MNGYSARPFLAMSMSFAHATKKITARTYITTGLVGEVLGAAAQAAHRMPIVSEMRAAITSSHRTARKVVGA